VFDSKQNSDEPVLLGARLETASFAAFTQWVLTGPAVIILLFTALNYALPIVTKQDQSFYHEPVLIFALLRQCYQSPFLTAITLIPVLLFCWKFPSIGYQWKKNPSVHSLRWFVVFVCAVLVWRFTTHPFNAVTGQAHHVDRLLLIALLAAVIWRPIAVLPLLLFVHLMIWQFQLEIGPYSWAQQSMPIKVLLMFCAALFWSRLNSRIDAALVVYLVIVVVLGHYWAPGFGKLLLSWWSHGEVHNLLSNTYANGWLGFLSQSEISTIIKGFSQFDEWVVALTLILEIGAVVALLHRRLAIGILTLAILFHTGVFAASGIFFWQWIFVDAALLILIIRRSWQLPAGISMVRGFILSVSLIASSPLWARPVMLAWHDVSINYVYRFNLIDLDGTATAIPPSCFAPFEYPFTQSTFSYLSEVKSLPLTWGASTSLDLAVKLSAAKSEESIAELEQLLGSLWFDADRAELMDKFLMTFYKNTRSVGEKIFWFDMLPAPHQLWTGSCDGVLNKVEAQFIQIDRITSWFDGQNYREFNTKKIRSVNLRPLNGSEK